MFIDREHLQALIPSITLLFLAIGLLVCWVFQRQQRFLLLQSCSYMLSALSFGFQSLASEELLFRYAAVTSSLYLLSGWLLARCWAEHWKLSIRPNIGLLIALVTLGFIIHYSNNLWARVHIGSAGIGLILLMPVVAAIKHKRSQDWLDQVLFMFALVYGVLTISRPIVITMLGHSHFDRYSLSLYWIATALSTLFFAILFAILMAALAIRATIRDLRRDRDLDPLTHIFNRRAFYELAKCRLEDKRLYPMALLAGDIDFFKRINDTWGHSRGDQVLQLVSATLQRNVRSEDLAARFGGEEFVLLLTRIDLAGAEQVAQRIRQELSANRNVLPPGEILRISFGIAPVANAQDLENALKQADELLYAAKNAGRDRVHVSGILYRTSAERSSNPSVATAHS